jgi:hypothetical protein
VTVEAIIDRIQRDWTSPPGEQPSRFVINDTGGISASDTTLITDTTLLSPEEEGLIAGGTLLEVESELILVEAVSGTSPDFTLTIRRGMYGTTAATHADATEIVIAGEDHVPRAAIFDAVADSIEGLWPDLWTVGVEETWSDTEPVELPATVGEVLDLLARSGSRWVRIGSWDELQNFPLSSTENAIQINGLGSNTEVQVYYKKKPTRPTAEADTLSSLGVESGWVKVIVANAVAALVANRDLNAATIDFITQSLEAEAGGPIGSGTDIRNALLQFQRVQLDSLKRALPLMQHDRVVIDESY